MGIIKDNEYLKNREGTDGYYGGMDAGNISLSSVHPLLEFGI